MYIPFFKAAPLALAITSVGFSSVSYAIDDGIQTVYVSATRSETAPVPVATQITVITAEQIRLSGASTVTDILRAQGGIQIQDLDGSGGRNVTVSMAGFSTNAANNILVLVDDRKLNNPSLAGPALNTVALKDIERIEIIHGSAGVLYGDQAVGGVINIVTRHGKAGELQGALSTRTGSRGLTDYSGNVSQGFENGINYNLSAQKRTSDNFRENNESSLINLLGNVGFNFSSGRVFLEKQKITDKLRVPGALMLEDAGINFRATQKPNDYSNQDTDLYRAGGDYAFSSQWKLVGEYSERKEKNYSFYDDYIKSDVYTPYSDPTKMNVKSFTPRLVGNFSAQHGAVLVTLGYDHIDSTYEAENRYIDIGQTLSAVYGQVIYPVSNAWALTLGARHAKAEDKDNSLSSQTSLSTNAGELGVHYQITDAWSYFARVADGFRFANADENGFRLSTVDFLKPQTSHSQETGLQWNDKNGSVKYSLFHMEVSNEIVYDPLVGYFGANINLPESERKGFLFEGNAVLSDQISLHANYTYTDAELTSGSFANKKVPFVATNVINAGVIFQLVKNVHLSIDGNYVGSRYLAGDDDNTYPKAEPVTLFNANLLWNINHIELGMRVKNITAEKYADYEGVNWRGRYLYPQPQRTYDLHATFSF